jgi:UDP-N-acetylmuramoylalanine-D-glutamate ligase
MFLAGRDRYRNTVATVAQAEAMLMLAEELHDSIRDFAQATHQCVCSEVP